MGDPNVLVLVCARGHAVVTYLAHRDQPAPPCPICGWVPPEAPPQEDPR